MTTLTIPYIDAYSKVSLKPSENEYPAAVNSEQLTVYDFRVEDPLKARGTEDEIDLDDYVAGQDADTQREIGEAGKWVADTFYPSQHTLATLRLRAGLTQRMLAERCGLEQPHVSRYESGRVEPGLIHAGKLAAALGVTLDEFALAFENSSQ
jgi:DNA-binding XRE family transcriptional regulator